MNCSEWEREIAGESESAGLKEHLAGCDRCREFTQELDANRMALRELTVHPTAFDAVRRRVLDEIQAKRRRAMWWSWPVAAAICAAILCLVYLLPRPRTQGPAAPKLVRVPEKAVPVVAQVAQVKEIARHKMARRRPGTGTSADAARKSACATCEPLTVKMLTSDPDVIIIWLVDQKGDSL